MTGYTVHTGSNEQFREGWDRVFKAKRSAGHSADNTQAAKTGQPKGGKDAVKKPKPRNK
ncbi:hypothetical protein [Planctomicrobium piriforme]|uniref:Uncharacterized protein n=1 Tax=Planctomicrobium piriforme TaxID=1576369 RepID=A0A1I3LCM3_9PLAN|nr:hypothetical protein [Planctomicrobium piriforme]SFI82552.1 hypothetical protein SAMN05421753_112221 [Planctomicrobium piriforme]